MNENKQLLTEWLSFDITPDQIKESRERNGGKIILKGILQKANTLNQNGRIYPESILEREVRNYQKFIKEKRALGECVDKETQIFTTCGWKSFEDLTGSEFVYTLDTTSNMLCESKIEFLTKKHYSGKMLHFTDTKNDVDMLLTPDHKMMLSNTGTFYVCANEATKYCSKDSNFSVLSSEPNNEKYEYFNLRDMNVKEVDHDDNVYCVTTDNGNWLAKRNGKMFWTGNCDHPDSSVVELKNVSHIIREAYMQGSVCYGTVELLDTPSGKILQSLVESGVTLGISSRGVGSTKRDGDTDIVQDDFQLICWDMVSEPSTPGAFMMKEGRSVSPNEIKKHFTKSDRIFRIFTDIEKW